MMPKETTITIDREGVLSKYPLPAIANVHTKEGLSHFVVVFKITKKYVVRSGKEFGKGGL